MYPVTFIANLCDSELYAVFDNKVEEIRAPECKMMADPVKLNAGETDCSTNFRYIRFNI